MTPKTSPSHRRRSGPLSASGRLGRACLARGSCLRRNKPTRRVCCLYRKLSSSPTTIPRTGRLLADCKIGNCAFTGRGDAIEQIGGDMLSTGGVNHQPKGLQNPSSDILGGWVAETVHVAERYLVEKEFVVIKIKGRPASIAVLHTTYPVCGSPRKKLRYFR